MNLKFLTIGLAYLSLPVALLASSWNPTLLVNTEAFQVIDEGDSATDIVMQFGDTLNETIAYERTLTQFSFSDDIHVSGDVTTTGTFSGNSLTLSNLTSCDQIITNSNGDFSCGTVVSLTGANLATIQVRRDSNFTLTNLNTFYDVPFNNTDTESDNTVLEHNGTNTERIDIKQNGFYLISYHINANDTFVTHQLDARVQVNGTTTLTGSLTIGRNYQNEYSPNVSTNVAFLNENDYITLQASRSTANTVINETVLTATKLNGIKGEKGDKGDSGITIADLEPAFVNQGGDTLTGALIINGAGLTASGTIETDDNLVINADNTGTDAILTLAMMP